MSNFLTNIRLNNLQQEIDNIVLAGPLTNPLLKDMDCGGFGVENAGLIQATSITTPSFTTTNEVSAGYIVASGNIAGNTFSQTFNGTTYASIENGDISAGAVTATNLYVGNPFASPSVVKGTVYDSVYNQPPAPTLEEVLTVGSVAGGNQSITVPSLFVGQIGMDPCTIQMQPGTHFLSYTQNEFAISTGLVYDTAYNTLPTAYTDLDVTNLRASSFTQYTGGFDQVTISGGGINCLTINTDNIASNDATPIQVQSAIQFQEEVAANDLSVTNITIPSGGTISCSTAGDLFQISDVQVLKTDNVSFTNQQAGGLYLALSANVIDTKSMLTVCTNGGANRGNIYDSYYNPPPSVAANSLSAILANNNSAGGNDITDGGDFNSASVSSDQIGSRSGGDILLLDTLQTRTGTTPNYTYGNVFDSLINPSFVEGVISRSFQTGFLNLTLNASVPSYSLAYFNPTSATPPLKNCQRIDFYLSELSFSLNEPDLFTSF